MTFLAKNLFEGKQFRELRSIYTWTGHHSSSLTVDVIILSGEYPIISEIFLLIKMDKPIFFLRRYQLMLWIIALLERFQECRKAITKPIINQLVYSANLKP